MVFQEVVLPRPKPVARQSLQCDLMPGYAGALSRNMHDDGVGNIPAFPPRPLRLQAKVCFLIVEEISFIEPETIVEELPADQEACAGNPINLGRR